LLLDTHTFAWWLGNPERLSATARREIARLGPRILVSAVSIYEMALKHRRGHWLEVAVIVADPVGQIVAEGMEALPLQLAHARAAGALDWDHRDPFDRMLAAQAIAEDATLVSADRAFAPLAQTGRLRLMWD